jgi:hypothetical protein
MGWRGLARPCRTGPAGCPARPAAAAARQGQAPVRFTGFPALLTFPEFPPSGARFRRQNHFYAHARPRRKRPRAIYSYFFRCPQRDGSYPQLNAVIHCIAHKLSTERARCGAREAGLPSVHRATAESTEAGEHGAEAGQSAFGDFCRRVVSWAAAWFGHNRTRPPPFMGWRGPCAACRIGLASCPACPAATSAPSGPGTRTRLRFPRASRVSGVSP